MNFSRTIKLLAILSVLGGIASMVGWIYDISWLKSLIPSSSAIKFTSAFCFIASGLILYNLSNYKKQAKPMAHALIPIASFILLILMGPFLIGLLFGIPTDPEEVFVKKDGRLVREQVEGMPSLASVVKFLLISFIGFSAIFYEDIKKRLITTGGFLVIVSLFGMIGYLINHSGFYTLNGISSPLSFNAAVIFLMIGIGFLLSGFNKEDEIRTFL